MIVLPQGPPPWPALIIIHPVTGLEEMMQQRAPSVIAEALINAFPCGANHKAGATTP